MNKIRRYYAHLFFAAFFVLSGLLAYRVSYNAHQAVPGYYTENIDEPYRPYPEDKKEEPKEHKLEQAVK